MSSPAQPGVGRAHGKLILLGEHAVVHGEPALALGLARGIEARAERAAGPLALDVPCWEYRLTVADGSPGAVALAALADALDLPLVERRVVVTPQLPAGVGLGSSAALAAACARALLSLDSLERSPAQLLAAVQASERVFHGNPSGLDATLALDGGLVRFTRAAGAEPLSFAPPGVVIASTGARGNTAEQVARFTAELDSGGGAAAARLARIGELVEAGIRALAADRLADLGRAMDENHALLDRFGVSTPELDRCCAVARAAGALGAKLTGAGGGGCAVALVEPAARPRVASALTDAGFEVLP